MNAAAKNFQGKSILWSLKQGNILDEPADVLICSANTSLNLSGGVGADLLGRYGTKMQDELHRILAARSPHVARQGEIFTYSGSELPYKAVLHTVAVDGWYHSSPEIVREIVERSFQLVANMSAQKVALTILATGYGDLGLNGFAKAIRPLLDSSFTPIKEVCLCLMEDYRLKELGCHLFSE